MAYRLAEESPAVVSPCRDHPGGAALSSRGLSEVSERSAEAAEQLTLAIAAFETEEFPLLVQELTSELPPRGAGRVVGGALRVDRPVPAFGRPGGACAVAYRPNDVVV